MLNLYVRLMRLRCLTIVTLILIAAQDVPPVAITSPDENAVLRGQVEVQGRLEASNFLVAHLDFAYASDSTGTWFPLRTFSEPVPEATLYTWDTTAISDGDYVLRLRVEFDDGTSQEVTVPVLVRNDVPAPTPTVEMSPTPDEASVFIPTPFLLAASPTPTTVPRATPTVLPTNPISVGPVAVYLSFGRGVLVMLGLFVFAGLILRLRRS